MILYGFDSDLPLKILDDHIYHALATRSDMQHNQSFLWIYGPEYSNPIISFQDKLQEMNLPSIYAIIPLNCGLGHIKATTPFVN
jgi:hypothetical protein